jgi:hypothetical protein
MSLQLFSSSKMIMPYVNLQFSATGGTAPYSYSVVAGGAGGAIDSVSGIYVAPTSYGTDAIVVEDSLGAQAFSAIVIGSAVQLVCDIIQQSMGLNAGQVWLWNQKINIPTDSNLYVALTVMSMKAFGSSNYFDGPTQTQIQSVNMHSLLDINIFSRSSIARDRKEEAIMALSSIYAQQQQSLNSFFLGRLPTGFVNLSEIDGAAIPYRFVATVGVQYMNKIISGAPYFDTFQQPTIAVNP